MKEAEEGESKRGTKEDEYGMRKRKRGMKNEGR